MKVNKVRVENMFRFKHPMLKTIVPGKYITILEQYVGEDIRISREGLITSNGFLQGDSWINIDNSSNFSSEAKSTSMLNNSNIIYVIISDMPLTRTYDVDDLNIHVINIKSLLDVQSCYFVYETEKITVIDFIGNNGESTLGLKSNDILEIEVCELDEFEGWKYKLKKLARQYGVFMDTRVVKGKLLGTDRSRTDCIKLDTSTDFSSSIERIILGDITKLISMERSQ